MTITQKAYLHFPKEVTGQPFIAHVVKEYNVMVNIFRAKVTPGKGGHLTIDLSGEAGAIERAFGYLKKSGVEIHTGDIGLVWDENRCVHCTNCTTHCPTGALHVADPGSRTVAFDEEKCIECLACLSNCPFGACKSLF